MSIYNEKFNVVFIHTPKTAGTSMEQAPFTGGGGHKTAQMMRDEVGEERWSRAFKFAFVRDPLDRFVSTFFHLLPKHEGKTLDSVVHEASRWSMKKRNRFTNHFSEQCFFFCNDADEVLVDFVGRFWNLRQDWATVCDRVGISFKLPHLRKGKHEDHTDCLTSELKSVIRQTYQRDYELLGRYFSES